MVDRSELSEVLLAKSPRHTPPYNRVSITSAFSMRPFGVNDASSKSYSSRLNRLSTPMRVGSVV